MVDNKYFSRSDQTFLGKYLDIFSFHYFTRPDESDPRETKEKGKSVFETRFSNKFYNHVSVGCTAKTVNYFSGLLRVCYGKIYYKSKTDLCKRISDSPMFVCCLNFYTF